MICGEGLELGASDVLLRARFNFPVGTIDVDSTG